MPQESISECSFSESELSNDNTVGGYIRQRVIDFFTEFETVKRVKLQSKSLRLPELTLYVLFTSYVVLYKFMYELQFLRCARSYAQPLVDLAMPSRNFQTCLDYVNCEILYPDVSDLNYCSEPLLPDNTSCSFFDI